MSNFSDYLQNYMDAQKISSGDLAKMMDYDRTSLFRYVKGTRIPSSIEIVEKIAEVLRMNVSEKKALLRYYDFLTMGKNMVENYEGVVSLLRYMAVVQSEIEEKKSYEKNAHGEFDKGIYELNSPDEIYNAIVYLGRTVVASGESHVLRVWVQPDYRMIQMFLRKNFEGTEVKIEQIICLEKDFSRNQENFKLFCEVLPTAISSANYTVRFYYDNVDAHINSMMWMPNVIFGDKIVILFDKEVKRGMLIKNDVFLGMIRKWYMEVRENTSEFLYKLDSVLQAFTFLMGGKQDFYSWSMIYSQPCLGTCISRDMYEERLLDFPGREVVMNQLLRQNGDWDGMNYIPGELQFMENCYFSREGMLRFIREGIADELPRSMYKPLNREQRKTVVDRLIRLSDLGCLEMHLVDDGIVIPREFCCILINEDKTMMINHINDHELSQIKVNEWGICQGFAMFKEYLHEKGLVTETQETIEWLEQIVNE